MPSIAAAAIGAAGAIGGSLIQSNAATSAAGEQASADQSAIAAQQGMFGQAKAALSPYYTAGSGQTLSTLQSLLNPGTAASTISTLPGFQFQSQWGTKSAENALAAEGLGGSSGPLASAISQYNNGLAGTYYNSDVANLQGLVNTGANSASALAGNATATGQGIASSTQAAGNATAAGTLGSANAIAGGLTGAGSSASNALLLNALLGNSGGGGLYGGGSQSGLSSLFSTSGSGGFAGFGG